MTRKHVSRDCIIVCTYIGDFALRNDINPICAPLIILRYVYIYIYISNKRFKVIIIVVGRYKKIKKKKKLFTQTEVGGKAY